MEQKILEMLPGRLLPWYRENKRDLPWRVDREPYHVWLSEIMLQQTRVEAVRGYYTRFLQALPTVEDLAACGGDRLRKLWEGLGYYNRVNNMKKAAQVIVQHYGGRFPQTYDQILALPGVGVYTAGAICSICFGQPTPAVDGNVLRVVSRLLNDATPIDHPAQRRRVQELLAACYPVEAGDFTQALMELGATVCGPNRQPACQDCPCRDLCLGYQKGTAASLPVKSPKKAKRLEHRTVFILRCGERYALTRRPETGLLAGLWQLPDVEGCLTAEQALSYLEKLGVRMKQIIRTGTKTHIFTHIKWEMHGIWLEASQQSDAFCWMTEQEVESQAVLPTAYRQFWVERNM